MTTTITAKIDATQLQTLHSKPVLLMTAPAANQILLPTFLAAFSEQVSDSAAALALCIAYGASAQAWITNGQSFTANNAVMVCQWFQFGGWVNWTKEQALGQPLSLYSDADQGPGISNGLTIMVNYETMTL